MAQMDNHALSSAMLFRAVLRLAFCQEGPIAISWHIICFTFIVSASVSALLALVGNPAPAFAHARIWTECLVGLRCPFSLSDLI